MKTLDKLDPTTLQPIVQALPYPPLFVTISGAHLYGFPSPASDVDLRGAYVLPLCAVLGLDACVIRAMPTTDSDGCRPPVPRHADHSFRWHGVHFWGDAGIGGRLGLDSVDGMPRNPRPCP